MQAEHGSQAARTLSTKLQLQRDYGHSLAQMPPTLCSAPNLATGVAAPYTDAPARQGTALNGLSVGAPAVKLSGAHTVCTYVSTTTSPLLALHMHIPKQPLAHHATTQPALQAKKLATSDMVLVPAFVLLNGTCLLRQVCVSTAFTPRFSSDLACTPVKEEVNAGGLLRF